MKKADKILNDFFKKAEDDGDINGSTGVLTDLALKEYTDPSENTRHGLPDKKSNKNAPKDSPECGAVCQMRHNGMTEEEAMAHWRKEHKASLVSSQKFLYNYFK